MAGGGEVEKLEVRQEVSDCRLALLTLLALIAFAANSILCRLALGNELIDPISYTIVRLLSGAIVLAILARAWRGSWWAAVLLFLYAAPFSLAYVELTTGTGALIAFSAVQLTMIGASIISGRHPRLMEWLGLGLAMAGLYLLVRPGLAAPSPIGALMMSVAGASWGLYSLIGRRSTDPLLETAGNFARASLLALLLGGVILVAQNQGLLRSLPVGIAPAISIHVSPVGLLLAVSSGAVTSALGYVVWYAALRGLAATRAALVQTSVPVLAAIGGILLLGEPATPRLAVAGGMILTGIVLTLPGKATVRLN